MSSEIVTPSDSGFNTRLGPHQVPRIACGNCGAKHHIDATTLDELGQCRECSAFLRRPTDAEQEKFTDFLVWNSRHLQTGTDQNGGVEQ